LIFDFSIFLESLDSALHEREVSKLEIDSLKEQNEQLFQQYEREKGFHKEYQQVIISLL
jgi:cell shape-determining protein MreC